MIEELMESLKGEDEEEELESIKSKAIENEMEELISYFKDGKVKDAAASLCTLFELMRGY